MPNRLADHVVLGATVIRVADIPTSAAWYEQHLGVHVTVHEHAEHPTGVFRFGSTLYSMLQLLPGDPPPRGSTSDPYIVAVVPEGLEAVHADLERGGVSVTPIGAGAGFRFFRLRDPDRNLIEITSPQA